MARKRRVFGASKRERRHQPMRMPFNRTCFALDSCGSVQTIDIGREFWQ